MNCPICELPLQMTERQGIEIDYCPKCRGVWLDRGELDKLIERSHGSFVVGERAAADRVPGLPTRPERRDYDHDEGYRGKRRKNWLEEIFD